MSELFTKKVERHLRRYAPHAIFAVIAIAILAVAGTSASSAVAAIEFFLGLEIGKRLLPRALAGMAPSAMKTRGTAMVIAAFALFFVWYGLHASIALLAFTLPLAVGTLYALGANSLCAAQMAGNR